MNLPKHTSTKELSVKQCKKLLDSHQPLLLIDCREAHEYAYCHLHNAILIPLSTFVQKSETAFSDPQEPAIIYCHHGVRSLHAVNHLREQGFSNTFSMQGGIDAWSLEIDPSIPRY